MSISLMKKLTVITPQNEMQHIIRKLIRGRCVEVRQLDLDEHDGYLKKKSYDTQRKELEAKISAIDRALPPLNKYSERRMGLGDGRVKINREEFLRDGSYDNSAAIVKKTNELLDELSQLDDEISSLNANIDTVQPWIDLGYPLSMTQTRKTKIIIGSFPKSLDTEPVCSSISELNAHFELINEDKNAKYCSVIVLDEDFDALMRAITPFGFVKIDLPDTDKTPTGAINDFQNKIKIASNRKQEIIEEFRELSMYIFDVEVMYDIESTRLTNIIAMQKSADSESCTFITGWVPADSEQKIAQILDKNLCAYEMRDPEENENPPVHLKNNGFSSTFEWVIGMYAYPKYGSFDPTFIMSIFYFFIFGLMFADVGYGLILAVAGFVVPKMMGMKDGMKRTFYMFGYCGISSMIMGVVFGGWFGDLPYAIMQNMMGIENAKEVVPFFNGIWFNPLDDPMMFLIVSLAAGGVHIIAGMAINFVLLCKKGRVLDAIFDIFSWWIIFAGIGVIFLVGTKEGLITIGVGALIIILTHGRHEKNIVMRFLKGLLGLYDITSYASDLLSYSRILALGLAAGVIGQVVNLVGTMGGATVLGFVALIAACLIGHTLNLAINILGSFVHTSRLQYLEFFNKFYEDGGEKFEALEPSEQYSKES